MSLLVTGLIQRSAHPSPSNGATEGVLYDETTDPATAEANAVPLDTMVPGAPGMLDVGHPEACEALARSAAAAGARVVRGVGDVEVVGGDVPLVRYEHDDVGQEVSARIVVGADGPYHAVFRTDPVLGGPRLAAQLGPERLPAEAFTERNVERILALA